MTDDALDLDTLVSLPDIPPSEPEPPFEEEIESVFSVGGEEAPDVEVDRDDGGWRVRIRARSDVAAFAPLVREGQYLDAPELVTYRDRVADLAAHRPAWLAGVYAPRLRPRRVAIPRVFHPVVRPLISESPTSVWPWCAVGKLFITRRNRGTQVGSGVLVGPNLLLTASHAMPWETNDFSVRFAPGYRNGNDRRFGHAFVDQWRGVRNADDVTGLDYVICQLSWRIGQRTGWFGSQSFANESSYYQRDKWFSVGYPATFQGGQIPAVEVPVNVVDIDGDGDGLELESHLFADGGWSGGPLWGFINGGPRVIGIESGSEKDFFDPTRTVFAGGRHMVDLVKYGYAHWV